jgi:hypothetical protein
VPGDIHTKDSHRQFQSIFPYKPSAINGPSQRFSHKRAPAWRAKSTKPSRAQSPIGQSALYKKLLESNKMEKMNKTQLDWVFVANALLTKHFGIGIEDTNLQQAVTSYIETNQQPFEAVNEAAEKYGLRRIDTKQGRGIKKPGPLGITDQQAVEIIAIDEVCAITEQDLEREYRWDEFEDKFEKQLFQNPLSSDRIWFETYGEELEFVMKIAETDVNRVFTMVDVGTDEDVEPEDDDGMRITQGFQFVNRFGYFVLAENYRDFIVDAAL